MRPFSFCLVFCLAAYPAFAQEAGPVANVSSEQSAAVASAAELPDAPAGVPAAVVKTDSSPPPDHFCPGEFPTNLTVKDCSFTERMRWDNFVINSVSDQAMLGSIVGSLSSQVIKSPAEWPRTWQYYGYRLGASYSGGVARGIVEFAIGSLPPHSDPRHVRCLEDPLLYKRYGDKLTEHCTGLQGQAFFRPAHVFTDAFTVRVSKPDGTGMRYPAVERLAGIYADAYASYPWQPGVENNFAAVSRRAGWNFLFTFVGSVWNEYGPSITARFGRTPVRTYR